MWPAVVARGNVEDVQRDSNFPVGDVDADFGGADHPGIDYGGLLAAIHRRRERHHLRGSLRREHERKRAGAEAEKLRHVRCLLVECQGGARSTKQTSWRSRRINEIGRIVARRPYGWRKRFRDAPA